MAAGIKMAVNTIIARMDDMMETKVKALVEEEVDLKI